MKWTFLLSLKLDMPIVAYRGVSQKSLQNCNSEDPDEATHYEPSHCLNRYMVLVCWAERINHSHKKSLDRLFIPRNIHIAGT